MPGLRIVVTAATRAPRHARRVPFPPCDDSPLMRNLTHPPITSITPITPIARLAVIAACAVPPLLAYNLTPSATLFNQLASFAGWGLVLMALAAAAARPQWRGGAAVWAVLILLVAPWVSVGWAGLPVSLALSSSGLIGAALVVLLTGQGLDASARPGWFEALCWGLLAAGLLSLAVSLVQVFMPGWTDGMVIAHSGIPGRAVGNMRQPNHLASLLMWACVAAVFLADRGRLAAVGRPALPVLLFALVFAVVLSASRTGMLGVLLLAVWGVLDRKLARASRWALLATPLMLGLSWALIAWWAGSGDGHAFGAGSRLAEGAGSPSRLAILANAWALLMQNPLTGVGWGEFNLAWSMTPFPARPIAFFDHTHNLAMQLAVELGLPVSAAVLGLLCWALWRAFRTSMVETGEAAVMRRCAVLLVLMIGLHSLLEYPLWYAYFLLPTAFALGLALGAGPGPRQAGPRRAGHAVPAIGAIGAMGAWLPGIGAVMVAVSAYAVWDYQKLVAIYAPPAQAAPLAQRIAEGQRSLLFAPQADYAAATSLGSDEAALDAARRTAHNLIDARLLIAWAKSLHATGDDERARHVVARLREFRSTAGDEWLAECELPLKASELPFQCGPATRAFGWREMR